MPISLTIEWLTFDERKPEYGQEITCIIPNKQKQDGSFRIVTGEFLSNNDLYVSDLEYYEQNEIAFWIPTSALKLTL